MRIRGSSGASSRCGLLWDSVLVDLKICGSVIAHWFSCERSHLDFYRYSLTRSRLLISEICQARKGGWYVGKAD